MNSYKYLKYSQYAKQALIFINFLAVTYYVFVYLFASKYIVAKNLSHVLLDKLDIVPIAPENIFFTTLFFLPSFSLSCFIEKVFLIKRKRLMIG